MTDLPKPDITHVVRSNLPWRSEHLTECGLDADRHPTWTRGEAIQTLKDLGSQRFSLFVCMTCWHTAERHDTWEDDPASCMARYADRLSLRWGTHRDDSEKRRFADELRAIAALVEAHRAEFDSLVEAFGQHVQITDLRQRRRQRRA